MAAELSLNKRGYIVTDAYDDLQGGVNYNCNGTTNLYFRCINTNNEPVLSGPYTIQTPTLNDAFLKIQKEKMVGTFVINIEEKTVEKVTY